MREDDDDEDESGGGGDERSRIGMAKLPWKRSTMTRIMPSRSLVFDANGNVMFVHLWPTPLPCIPPEGPRKQRSPGGILIFDSSRSDLVLSRERRTWKGSGGWKQ
jgi:hypothetical protein